MKLDIDDFAVKGERGVDFFRRRQDQTSRRARFVCIATAIDAPSDATTPPQALPAPEGHEAQGRLLICHEPGARKAAASLWEALARFEAQPALHRPFSLGDAPGYPGTEGLQSPVELFLYVEFFRERQLAAHSLDEFALALDADARCAAQTDPGELAATLRLALDYNLIGRGNALWPLLQPLLAARAAVRDLPQEFAGSTAYALRISGDLRLRAGAFEDALSAFETALKLGDNAFRRRRAIEAALAAGRSDAARRHITAFAAHGRLPADLQALAESAGIEAPTGGAEAGARQGPKAP